MPRNQYDTKTKTAIIEAAKEARAKGETWLVAFDAAKKAGYNGSLQGITKMLRALDKKAGKPKGKRGRKPGRKPGRPAGHKPGRPAGHKPGRPAGRKPGRPAGRKPGRPAGRPKAGLSSIDAMVSVLVQERVSAILDRAIEILTAARG